MNIRATAQDTPEAATAAGVVVLELWLYANKDEGAPTDFSDQFPANEEDKIYMGEMRVPVSGTPVDGTYETTWTVPSGGAIDVTRDGAHSAEVPAGQTRRYLMPSGQYKIQAHGIDAGWLAAPGAPGFSNKNTVTLNTGTVVTPPPSPDPAPSTSSPAPAPSPSVNGSELLTNGSLESVTGGVPNCFQVSGWGDGTWSGSVVADAHTGSNGYQITMSGRTRGDRKLMVKEDNVCSTQAADGKTYDLSVWYKSTNSTSNITVFRQTAAGWVYWTDLGTFPVSTTWRQVTVRTPVVPAGTARFAWGVSMDSNGTLTTDDYSTVLTGGGTATTPPATTEPPPPAPSGDELIVNGNLAAGTGAIPQCYLSTGWGTHSFTQGYSTDMPSAVTGRSWRYTLSGYSSGDRKLIHSDAAGCAPAVKQGGVYNIELWYKSTTPTSAITVFRHTASGWGYWTDVKTLPPVSGWTKATAVLPEVPNGTDRIAWGVSAAGNGTILTTGYSMKENVVVPATGGLERTGRWSVLTTQLPVRAIHATLLQDSRVLLIAGSGNDPAQFTAKSFKTVVWNPANDTFKDIPTPDDLFCSGHVTLPDGKVLIAGGTGAYPGANDAVTSFKGAKFSYLFDPKTDSYTRTNDMAEEHWYPTLTKIENGDVWAAGGLNIRAEGNVNTEMFDYSALRWLGLNEVPQTYSFWGTYPHMFLLQDGRMFYSGAHTFGNGLPGTGASLYNWRTASIYDVPGLRDKDLRDQAGSVLLPPAQDQKVMIVGGGNTDSNARGTNSVDIIDLKAANPAYTPAPNMPGPGKGYVNVLNLPDRTVLAANGSAFNRSDNVFTAGIYSPVSNTWTDVAADPVGRNYHSTALLLPDGRVATFGSNPLDNSFELRISVYEPPYLFKGTRPTVTSAPSSAGYGATFGIGVTGNAVSASLMSPGSITHQTDTNARLVDVPISGTGATRTAQITANPRLLPPGPYMLTVVDDKGVPSVARWITIY
jgi:hypothetical protein